jgi:flagellar motor switch/type III secretory pathway protein FliN
MTTCVVIHRVAALATKTCWLRRPVGYEDLLATKKLSRLLAKENGLEKRRRFRDKSQEELDPPLWQLQELTELFPVASVPRMVVMSHRRAGSPSKNSGKGLSPKPAPAPSPAATSTPESAERPSAIKIPTELTPSMPLAVVDWQTFQETEEPAQQPSSGSNQPSSVPLQDESMVSMRIPVGSISLSPAQLKQLRPGTILTLDQRIDEPVVIWIDHQPAARGTLLQRDGSCTVRIEQPLSGTLPYDMSSSNAGPSATRKAA